MDHDIVLLHRHFDADHLETVKAQMTRFNISRKGDTVLIKLDSGACVGTIFDDDPNRIIVDNLADTPNIFADQPLDYGDEMAKSGLTAQTARRIADMPQQTNLPYGI